MRIFADFCVKISVLFSDPSLRLDFQTMSGYTATTAGVCTDKFEATGQTGSNPPAICGINTGYHSKLSWILEFGMSQYSTFLPLKCMLSSEQQSLIP